MLRIVRVLLVAPWLLLAACAGGEPAPAGPIGKPLQGPVAQPQLIVEADGSVLLVWRREGDEGSDLFAAKRHEDGSFSEPTQINDVPGSVSGYDLDELRASVAVGAAGELAVAWGDTHGDVWVAFGGSHGATFDPPVRMNQNKETGAQSFPSIAFDGDGVLHAVWLDTRVSGTMQEEPADLYYARVTADGVTERNLTDDDTPSVCGCCRPGITAYEGGEVVVAFRNTTTDGYRDIFLTSGNLSSGFESLRRIGPPLWELSGCPMAGPLPLGEETLWNDASTGDRRTLIGQGFDRDPLVLLASSEDKTILYPPRRVAGTKSSWLLVPADPSAYLLHRDQEDGWVIAADDLPRWVTSAALVQGRFLLAGTEKDALRLEERAADPS